MNIDALAILGVLALLTRCGHTLHTMGAVRARSVAAVAVRAFIGSAGMVLLIWVVGHAVNAFATRGDGFNGASNAAASGVSSPTLIWFASPRSFLRVLPLALLPAALIDAATAERARIRGLFVAVGVLTLILLPILVSIGWRLTDWIDEPLSGLALVWPLIVGHVLASAAALTLARVIGARSGKYNRDGSANFIPAHSLPIVIGGDVLLVIGLPMMAAAIAGDPAARVVNAVLAGSAAVLTAVFAVTLRRTPVDALNPAAGAIAGLVAGSLCAPQLPWVAIALGGIVGIVIPYALLKLDLKYRIDEPSGLALPHLLGGLAGAVGAGIGAALEIGPTVTAGAIVRSTGIAAGGAIVVLIVGVGVSLALGVLLQKLNWLRVDAAVESEGLDLAEHDVNAYPDFQQTMIKSYHLRQ